MIYIRFNKKPAETARVCVNLFDTESLEKHSARNDQFPFFVPSIAITHTDDPEIQSGEKSLAQDQKLQQRDESADGRSFHIGLFGLDKLHNNERTVQNLEQALNQIGPECLDAFGRGHENNLQADRIDRLTNPYNFLISKLATFPIHFVCELIAGFLPQPITEN